MTKFSPYNVVKQAISGLKANEKTVISGRFGIDEEKKTLSAIGRSLKLSRERIRQIEKEALKKLTFAIVEKNHEYATRIIDIFNQHGGISAHSTVAEKFFDAVTRTNQNELNALNLIFYLMPQLIKIEKTKEIEASWMLSTLDKKEVVSIIDQWASHLAKVKKPMTIDVLVKNNPDHSKYEITFLSELPRISKKIVQTETGHIGLVSWPEVNPRNVRDKIYYILKQEGKPLHFSDIAEKINTREFGKRGVVRATVHNELIADSRFVLVGRGIYALAEWGYEPGTVKDMIANVLQGKTSGMDAEEIVSEVLKQRSVKKSTILINLQTKPEFQRVKGNVFALK